MGTRGEDTEHNRKAGNVAHAEPSAFMVRFERDPPTKRADRHLPCLASHAFMKVISSSCALMTASASLRTSGSFPYFKDDVGHVDGALVMGDHAAHEVDVGVASQLDVHALVHLLIRCLEGLRHFIARRRGGGRTVVLVLVLRERDRSEDDKGCSEGGTGDFHVSSVECHLLVCRSGGEPIVGVCVWRSSQNSAWGPYQGCDALSCQGA